MGISRPVKDTGGVVDRGPAIVRWQFHGSVRCGVGV